MKPTQPSQVHFNFIQLNRPKVIFASGKEENPRSPLAPPHIMILIIINTPLRRIARQLLHLLKLRHRNLIPQMALQQLMRNEPLRRIPLRIHKAHMMIHIADALQLVRMAMMMRTPIHANQEDRHMRPRQAEEIELELVHVGCFAVQQEEEAQHGCFGPGLPPVYRVVGRGLGVFLEVEFFDFLPARHDAGAAADADVAPHGVEVLVVDRADVAGRAGEGRHVVAAEFVVVVRHRVGEAADDGFCDVWEIVSWWEEWEGGICLPLFLGCVERE